MSYLSATPLLDFLGNLSLKFSRNKDKITALLCSVTAVTDEAAQEKIDEVVALLDYDKKEEVSVFDVVNASRYQTPYYEARRKAALAFLRNTIAMRTKVLEVWLTTRNPDLATLIVEKSWVPEYSANARVLVLLKQNRITEKWRHTVEELTAIVAATQDEDLQIAERAKNFLWRQADFYSDTLAAIWLGSKAPIITEILVARKFIPSKPVELRVLVALLVGGESVKLLTNRQELAALLTLCESDDASLAQRARDCLYQLPQQRLDTLYSLWAESRQPFLLEVIKQRKYLPKKAGPARVLVALQLGEWERLASKLKPEEILTLARACDDSRPIIAKNAKLALASLQKLELIQKFCDIIIKEELPNASKVALEKNFVPAESYERVLFYFATEQWDKYEALDFDYRILRTVYTTADPVFRRRLGDKIRKSGRTEYLTVIVGTHNSSSSEISLNREEAELLVELLSANREWSKLWLLVYELPLYLSMQVVQRLTEANWQPITEEESLLFVQLQQLVQGETLLDVDVLEKLLPLAMLRARTRATGRINDIAFAPSHSHIAIGTNAGKVILWNIKQGKREKVLKGFQHSIGKLAYTKNGTLLCAEKTNNSYHICGVYLWHGEGEPVRIGEHRGSITALEVLPNNEQVLTASSDGTIKLWNTMNGALIKQSKLEFSFENNTLMYSFWARGVCVSPDASYTAVLHDGITLLSLPELNHLAYGYAPRKSYCGIFPPDGKAIIAANSMKGNSFFKCEDGSVQLFNYQGKRENPSWQEDKTMGVALKAGSDIIVIGNSNGNVHFNDWAKKQWLGKVTTEGKGLTSLKLSPDGFFMATGDKDSVFSLWDLRPLEVRRLLSQNLAQANLSQLIALNVLTESDILANFPQNTQTALQFLSLVLNQRFRHEIELEDVPMLSTGDFDIELEG